MQRAWPVSVYITSNKKDISRSRCYSGSFCERMQLRTSAPLKLVRCLWKAGAALLSNPHLQRYTAHRNKKLNHTEIAIDFDDNVLLSLDPPCPSYLRERPQSDAIYPRTIA